MFQKMLQGGSGSGEVDYFYWASTSNKKTTTIITSGYKKITFVVVKDSRNQFTEDFPIANVKEFTIEELATNKNINIPKSITGWASDYVAIVNATTISVDTDGVGFMVIKHK